jgi:B-cell receptor-associated protein 31
MLLVAEMSIFMLLIVPLPYTMKRRLFTFISESPLIAKLQYGMKVSIEPCTQLSLRAKINR